MQLLGGEDHGDDEPGPVRAPGQLVRDDRLDQPEGEEQQADDAGRGHRLVGGHPGHRADVLSPREGEGPHDHVEHGDERGEHHHDGDGERAAGRGGSAHGVLLAARETGWPGSARTPVATRRAMTSSHSDPGGPTGQCWRPREGAIHPTGVSAGGHSSSDAEAPGASWSASSTATLRCSRVGRATRVDAVIRK